MPMYTYHCSKCNSEFEILQKMDAPNLKKNPDCKEKGCKLKKVPSVFTPNFIGNGFYSNDYKNKK